MTDEPRPQIFTMTYYDFVEGLKAFQGICLACGDIAESCDYGASKDFCDACGQNTVSGYAAALMAGRIRCHDDDTSTEQHDDTNRRRHLLKMSDGEIAELDFVADDEPLSAADYPKPWTVEQVGRVWIAWRVTY